MTEKVLTSRRVLIDFEVLIEKSSKGGCGDGLRRTSPRFPILYRPEFGRKPCGDQHGDGLGLA